MVLIGVTAVIAVHLHGNEILKSFTAGQPSSASGDINRALFCKTHCLLFVDQQAIRYLILLPKP